MKFVLIYFSISLILYILMCIKYKRIVKVDPRYCLETVLFAPVLILYLIWEKL